MKDAFLAVSVVVPVYNMAERLANCLDSLLAQTLQELEIILINDGSTDNSGDICRQYAAKYEHIRLHEGENHGVSTAYNIGLDMARGDFVAFCDSDDFVAPTMYQVMYEQAVANHADMSCCRLRCGRNMDELRANTPALMDGVFERQDILDQWFLPLLLPRLGQRVFGYQVLCLFRRELLEQHHIRYQSGLSMHEDRVFILQYLPHVRRMTATPEPFYNYVFHDNSLCAKYFVKKEVPIHTREREWLLNARCQEQLVRNSDVQTIWPWLLPEMILDRLFHECRNTVFDPSLPNLKDKLNILRQVLRTTLPELPWAASRTLPWRQRGFHALCSLGTVAVYAACRFQPPRQRE